MLFRPGRIQTVRKMWTSSVLIKRQVKPDCIELTNQSFHPNLNSKHGQTDAISHIYAYNYQNPRWKMCFENIITRAIYVFCGCIEERRRGKCNVFFPDPWTEKSYTSDCISYNIGFTLYYIRVFNMCPIACWRISTCARVCQLFREAATFTVQSKDGISESSRRPLF